MHSKPPSHPSTDEWAQSALQLHEEAKKTKSNQFKTDSTGVRNLELLPAEETLAGNNGKITFREFEPDTYNGPKKEDFIKLANSYYKVARKKLEDLKNPAAIEILDLRMNDFLELMNTPEKIPKDTDTKSRFQTLKETVLPKKKDKPLPTGAGELSLKIENTEKLLRELNVDFAAILLHSENKKINTSNLEKKGKALRKLVQKQIEQDGRANTVHLYKVPDPNNPSTSIERISSVTTIGKNTVPSSVRTGDYQRQGTAISNFVRRNYGNVTRDATGKPTVTTEFTGLTHSSYPPVDLFMRTGWTKLPKPINAFLNKWETKIFGVSLDAEIQIRERAIKGVEQVLLEFAQEEIAKGNSTQPITINLTTLSLVTPILTKLFERQIRPGISESKQLEETMLALSMCRGRKAFKVTGPDGKSIEIKVDMTQINMPTNLGTGFKPYKIAELNPSQQYSHARGFIDYCTNINLYLKDPKNIPVDLQGLRFDGVNKCLAPSLSADLIANEKSLRTEIDRKYKEFYDLQIKLQTPPNDKGDLARYKQCYNDIGDLENEHKKVCLQLTKEHKKSFNTNKKEARKELEAAERSTRTLPSDDPLRVYVDNCRLMFDAQKIYHKGTYKKANNAYEFQARYLLSNQRMGRKVEWFCKSAEDRSGRLGEKVEEALSFNKIYGRFPSTKADQLKINNSISLRVHEGSINRQVTDDNDPGSRGLQVGSNFGSKHLLLSKIDKKMSQLAKNVLKLKGIKPSSKVRNALDTPGSSTLLYDVLSSTPDEPKGKPKENKPLEKMDAEIDRWEKLQQQGFQLLSSTEEQEKNSALKQLKLLRQELKDQDLSPKDREDILQKAENHFLKLKGLYPGSQAALMQDSVNFGYLAKTKKKLKLSCRCDTPEAYEKLAKQSAQEVKKLAKGATVIKDKISTAHQELLKGVLYKETPAGGAEISIPPDQHIKRTYNAHAKKAEIHMNSSGDRAIFVALQMNQKFIPIQIELPKSSTIDAHTITFVVNTMLAAKMLGIPANYDHKYDEVLRKPEFQDQRTLLEIIKHTTGQELAAFSQPNSTLSALSKALLEAAAPKEKQNFTI